MKIFNILYAIYYFISFVRFIDGNYKPSNFTIGILLLIVVVAFLRFAFD